MEIRDFYALLNEENYGPVFLDEPMKKYTSWRIGGPADILYQPTDPNECAEVLKLAGQYGIPVTLIGSGTNLLIADEGVRGLVIQTAGFREFSWDGEQVTSGSGVPISHLSRSAADKSLSGLEFACGIPGSLGGAVVMNAGAYGFCLENVLVSVKTLDVNGNIKEYVKNELELGYRYSIFKKKKELIIEAALSLKPGDETEIKNLMTGYLNSRKEKQPLELPNCGSVFKNTGQGAGRLVEGVGAKGWRVGDAQVSMKHANFIVNLGNAKAMDVVRLIGEVQEAVRKNYSVELETEVVFLGFEDNRR